MSTDHYLKCDKCEKTCMSHSRYFPCRFSLDPCGQLLDFLADHCVDKADYCDGKLSVISEHEIYE